MASETLGVAAQSSPIAKQARACLQLFERLSDLFDCGDVPIYGITRVQVLDLNGQLRVWASNIGALQLRGTRSSLDYRLRDTPKFAGEVVSLLEDLAETLEDVYAIASGERENRSGTPILSLLEKLDDNCGDSPRVSGSGQAPPIEAAEHDEETREELFKLSVLIRNSSSRDRYAKALTAGSKAPFDPSYDIDHVQNKFPRLRKKEIEWLKTRLGKAITQRRQYLWYCRDHREKMAKVAETAAAAFPEAQDAGAETQGTTVLLNVHGKQPLQRTDDTKSQVSKQPSTLAPTTATTVIPSRLETSDLLGRLDEEPNDRDSRSVTSYASSVGEDEEDNRLSVVQFQEVATPNEPFECPYCWTIQQFNGHHAWKKHVMADLKPYVCTAEACDMTLFADSHTWFSHELQNHLVEWHCCFCFRAAFSTLEEFQSHVVKSHGIRFGEDQLASLSQACQKPMDQFMPSACRICDTWEETLRALNKHIPNDETLAVTPQQLRHHVRGHMEQLALFAIPRGYREDVDGESGKAAQGGGSHASSDQSFPVSSDSSEYTVYTIAERFDGQAMSLLLDRRGDHITITEEIVKAAAGNEGNGKDVMALLLDRRGDQITITEEVVKAAAGNSQHGVMALLLDTGKADLDAMGGRTPLSWAAEKGHEAIVKLLDTDEVDIDAKRAMLPDEMLTAVAARLGDKDEDVRRAAVEALGGRADLPDEVLTAVAARLEHSDSDVRSAAVDVLRGRKALPDELLMAVAARLDDSDSGVRRAAVQALGGRSELPEAVLTAVAARLDHGDWHVRGAAVQALGGRADLPDEVLPAVAARLDDEVGAEQTPPTLSLTASQVDPEPAPFTRVREVGNVDSLYM
ncbi:hypothetical protein ARSEF4850_008512 [Beauveria asiatica]